MSRKWIIGRSWLLGKGIFFFHRPFVSVKPKHSIRVYPCPSVAQNQPSKVDRTSKKASDLATDGHGYTRMRSVGFLAIDWEKIGTKLYGYVLAKRSTREFS